jgi:pyridoxal phosphate enzyme (YggS family)
MAPSRYFQLEQEILEIALDRKINPPTILCVSKNHPWEALEQLIKIGITQFGENRAQEAKDKFQDKNLSGLELHFIGHLQRNKVKTVVPLFSWIDSVDSLKLAKEIEKAAREYNKPMNLLFEVKTSDEPNKSGIESYTELLDIISFALDSPLLIPRGLMTIAPFTPDTSKVRASFQQLRVYFEQIANTVSFSNWNTLSMGMSDDYQIALEEGSTMIRIGTYIFGSREFGI